MGNKAITLEQAKLLYDAVRNGSASPSSPLSSSYSKVSEMIADTALKVGDVCATNGYYTKGDGGAGVYFITEHAESDGGMVVALSNGLSATLIPEDNTVYSAQYGVKADSSTDDSDAMNRFLSLVSTKKYNLQVTATGKRMKLTKPLVINGGNVIRQGVVDFGGVELFYNGA